jgi:hypothetical protein
MTGGFMAALADFMARPRHRTASLAATPALSAVFSTVGSPAASRHAADPALAVEGSTVAAVVTVVAAVTDEIRWRPSDTGKGRHAEKHMHTTHARFEGFRGRQLAGILMLAVIALLMTGRADASSPQLARPKTFSSAGDASEALYQAVRSHDEPAIQAILGAGKEITSSGDDNGDSLERERFCQKYQEMHRLVREPDGSTVLYIGAENWPFPIPLTSRNGMWSFDAKTGTAEILFRRLGENEATALNLCRELVTGAQEPPPPDQPLHGYYFRRVGEPLPKMAAQDARPHGGKQIVGAQFVAYPAEYRSSGVMTFIVASDGTIYERDLGPDTSTLAPAIKVRKPASAWRVVNTSDDAGPTPSSR